MNFVNKDNYREITLEEGLREIVKDRSKKLYSDGLEEDEYMYYDPDKGICYEDGCIIGRTANKALEVLISLEWVLHYKFYIN